jgi:coenzyme F420-reducing hydrogenase alpha subunit
VVSNGFAVEGDIGITLTTERGRIVGVAIANHRPLGLASHLAGVSPASALSRVATLFSACRIAQSVAGCMAVERALGIDLAPSQKAARAFLLRGETVLEHATSALLDWPVLMRQRPAGLRVVKVLRSSFADLWRSVYPDGDWMRPGGGHLAPDKAALVARQEAAEDAIEEARLVFPLDITGCQEWLGGARGPAAGLLRLLKTEGWAGCGASNVPLLERIGEPTLEAVLEQSLAADNDARFIALPEYKGEARETGPLARRMEEPVIKENIAEHGRGLAARFLAQCVETMRCLEEMRSIADELADDNGADVGSPIMASSGTGVAMVEAARGRLAHRVEIMDGQVCRYQILAPTEWNFHPQGALVRGLTEGGAGPPPEHLAQLLVAALDPCVPCQIEMR